MGTYNTSSTLLHDVYLIYLRKSRQDDPRETVEEVLEKHETMLQEYAQREFGGKIPEENIYREVVSGESIDDRVEIQKLLARVEDPRIKGVLVVEPQRLSRGDLEDCGRLISELRYTRTEVVTPYMTYNLENKMERRFFQDELLRGRDYLEYTKEILMRGRIAAVKRGCYIGQFAPYGYRKVKIGKDHTLEIVEHEADVVRLIFDLYTKEGVTRGRIANRLNEMGLTAPRGGKWAKDTVRMIVRNPHYVGKVVFNRFKETVVIENGERVVKRLAQPDDEIVIAEGKQPAIIDAKTWEAAQKLVTSHPKVKYKYPLKNPLSGVLVCSKCKRALALHPYKHAETRYECKSKPRCFKSVKVSEVEQAVIVALEESELPALELRVKNGDGNAVKIQQKLLAKLEKQMEEFRAQEDKQFELLETGRYTQDLFDRRNAVLRAKMDECQKNIYLTKSTMPESVDYAERVVTLKNCIELLKAPEATPAEKNKILRTIVQRIEFTGVESHGADRKGKRQVSEPFSLKVFLSL